MERGTNLTQIGMQLWLTLSHCQAFAKSRNAMTCKETLRTSWHTYTLLMINICNLLEIIEKKCLLTLEVIAQTRSPGIYFVFLHFPKQLQDTLQNSRDFLVKKVNAFRSAATFFLMLCLTISRSGVHS